MANRKIRGSESGWGNGRYNEDTKRNNIIEANPRVMCVCECEQWLTKYWHKCQTQIRAQGQGSTLRRRSHQQSLEQKMQVAKSSRFRVRGRALCSNPKQTGETELNRTEQNRHFTHYAIKQYWGEGEAKVH